MKVSEMRGKDSRELSLDLHELRKEAFNMRFRAASEEVAKTARFKEIRRTVRGVPFALGFTPEAIEGTCLVGEPAAIAEQIRKGASLGLDEVSLLPPLAQAREQVRDFATKVIPLL